MDLVTSLTAELVTVPNSILTTPTTPVNVEIELDEIKSLFNTMFYKMMANRGVGLSAPQMGISKSLCIFRDTTLNKVYRLINPKIIRHGREIISKSEGCLSIPNVIVEVPRFHRIEIETDQLDGSKTILKLSSTLARIAQHEIDHLNGKLITDYLNTSP